MSEPRGVSVLRRKAVTQSEKLISVGSASENLRLHIIDAVEVLNAYDEQAAALTLASQRFEDCKDAHDYMEAALTDVLGGGFVSDHANRLAPDQYTLVDRVRMMVIEHEEAVEELTQRAEAAEAVLATFKAVGAMELREQRDRAEAERDALRRDAARLREEVQYVADLAWAANETWEHEKDEELGREIKVIAHAINAALAVQPTTEGL